MTGGLALSASCNSAITRPSVESSPTRVSRTTRWPSPLIEPLNTSLPTSTSTGTDSPVIEAVSTLEAPACTRPSAGMRSPARRSIRSPARRCLRVHLLDLAVRQQPAGLDLGELAQRPDRFLRAEQRALLQDMSQRHDQRQQRRRHQVACRPGGDQGERDQLIGDAVQIRIAQRLPGRRQRRHRHQERRDARHQLGDVALARRQELQRGREDEAAAGDEREGEAQAERELLGAAEQAVARGRRQGRGLGGHAHRGTGPGSIIWMPPLLSTVSTRAALASSGPMRS